ncbi:MAG TPA: hypothetical protein PLD84_12160 [Chitinophagales bacterium]|nr:hypothetical protein [Chitinophagales bacterium]
MLYICQRMKGFRPIVGSVLATVMVLQSLSLLYVQCEFNLNQAYIAKVLCVNRDKPKLHCDGKCYLMKELNRNAAPENNHQKEIPSYSAVTLFIDQPLKQVIFPVSQEISKLSLQNYFSSGFLITSERPPTV